MNNSTNTYFVTTLCIENKSSIWSDDHSADFCPKSQGTRVYLVKNCKDDRDAMAAVSLWLVRTGNICLHWVEIPQSASKDVPDSDHIHFEVKVIDNADHPVDIHNKIKDLVNPLGPC